MADVDFFLKLEGIDGETEDGAHKGAIDLVSWNWGQSQSGTGGKGSGAGAGKVRLNDFHFSTRVSKASAKLMLYCASGAPVKKAVLTCRKAGTTQQEYFKITMSDSLVSNYHIRGGSSAVVPVEEFSLNFAKIEFEYKAQKADGNLDSPIKAGWDAARNTKV